MARNDITPYEPLSRSSQLVLVSFMIYAPWYLGWRLTSFNPEALLFSWLVYAAEVFGFITALLHFFMTWRLTKRTAPDVPPGLSTDIFIPTINEPVSIVRKTLLAARHVDYPHQTWLLDDGNRPEIKALAEELGCKYLARETNDGAKAGNLNNALAHSCGEFVAIFDADHAPQRNFLLKTLGYFCDPKLAFVQTPQDFYNLDSYQHRWKHNNRQVWTEQSLFFRIIQRGKDYWNAAFLCGSCVVLRRSALEAIGGFATETVTEDLHTSLRLHMKGFRSLYHHESLAFGLAPDKVSAFLNQRIRWGQGAMHVWRKEGLLFNTRLTLAQRMNYMASVLTYFDGWQKIIFYTAPIIVLVTGTMPINTLSTEFLAYFIPYFILTFWAFEEVARGYGRSLFIEQYNMIRFAAFARSTLAIFSGKLRFKVTDKSGSTSTPESRHMIPQILVLAFSVIAIIVGISLTVYHTWLPAEGLIANVFWAGINASLALAAVVFTVHRGHRRVVYRFPVSLPVSLDTPSGKTYGTIDDISSKGFRLYAKLPENISIGDTLTGELLIPTGSLKFHAVVRRTIEGHTENNEYIKAFGCEFQWNNAAEQDALDLFLYGSDLQWQLHNLQEHASTPIETIAKVFKHRLRSSVLTTANWAPVIYFTKNEAQRHKPGIGLISRLGDSNTDIYALLFDKLADNTIIEGTIVTRSESSPLCASIDLQRNMKSPVAPIFLYSVKLENDNVCETDRVHSILSSLKGKKPRWRREMTTNVHKISAGRLKSGLLIPGFLIMALSSLLPAPTQARELLSMFGLEVSPGNSYAYAGFIAPVSDTHFGRGWVQRYWLDWLTYEYGSTQITRATAPGASAALGYTWSGSDYRYTTYFGLGYRRTNLSPDDPNNIARGDQLGVVMQFDGEKALPQHWKAEAIVSLATADSGYWSRLRLIRDTGRLINIGSEFILQGNLEYTSWQVGIIGTGLKIDSSTELGLKAGFRHNSNESATSYFGFEIARNW